MEKTDKNQTENKENKKVTEDGVTASSETFPVVGIGASAGGLEAFSSFFRKIPDDTGMAFILIQHIEPSHVSNMVELIKKYTPMPIVEVKDRVKVEPNHVYMIPQNRPTSISGRILTLAKPTGVLIGHSIDPFFRSLADDLKEKAICVILSGTGTDGTVGARAVKAEGGLVMVQDPGDARYDGMPRSAIDAGLADFILPAEKMGEKLLEYVEEFQGQTPEKRRKSLENSEEALKQIFALIHARTKRDFSGYKVSTVNRRIERRMNLNKIQRIEDYVKLIQENRDELTALAKDFLIQVTNFFRDPEAFAALKVYVKNMIEKKPPEESFRAWVAGCATGEEAYSIAILVQECLEELNRAQDFQVFATDLDANAIEYAREASYPDGIVADVGKDYLKKYFVKMNSHYKVNKELREKVVFAVHDLISDAPFSRIDLASARNLLIYLDAPTQKKVIPLLFYSLKEGGILFLGTAETVGEFTNQFETLDRKWKIYRVSKKLGRIPKELNLANLETLPVAQAQPGQAKSLREESEAEKALLKAMPPAVLIDNNLKVLFVHGETGRYLRFKEGKPSYNLIDIARDDIRVPLSTAIYQAISQHQTVVREDIPLRVNGNKYRVKVTVKPDMDTEATRLTVLFEDYPEKKGKRRLKGSSAELEEHSQALEQELQFTRENLKSTVEELETANEELRSTLEEYQSTNEELHSTNEELETSKEELQSTNEELNTVNNEFQKKIEEMSTVNDDMRNLLNSTNVATIYLDEEKRIKRFTPTATRILNLMDRDIGRPVKDITSVLSADNLVESIEKVMETLIPVEEDVQTRENKWYSMRIYPYRTTQNAIAGAVISFIEISQQKAFQSELQESLNYTNSILDTMREPMVVLDGKLKVISVNQAFYRTFKVQPEQTEGKLLYDLGNGQWNIPELRKLLEEILPKNSHFEDYSVKHTFQDIGPREILLNARRLKSTNKGPDRILLAMEDITGQERKQPKPRNGK